MRFKVTSDFYPAGDVDLSIAADATASVADVAAQLAAADLSGNGFVASALTLRVTEAGGVARNLDAGLGIVDSGLRSGARIAVTASGAAPTRQAAAVLRVVSPVGTPERSSACPPGSA